MARPDDLDDHNRLLWTIGTVAQADAQLQMAIRSLWSGLAHLGHGGPPEKDPPRDGQPLRENCRRRIRSVDGLPDAVVEAARAVLDGVEAAAHLRHRVVHDLWLSPEGVGIGYAGEAAAWLRVNPGKMTPQAGIRGELSHLSYAEACARDLRRCHKAVMILMLLLSEFTPILLGGISSNSVDELLERLGELTRREPEPPGV